LLKEKGAKSVSAYCTHGVLSGDALNTIQQSNLKKLYISDTVRETVTSDKVEVVTSAALLAKAIDSLINNKSMGHL
jgi:ribose-phosphate pyrophosphokinase